MATNETIEQLAAGNLVGSVSDALVYDQQRVYNPNNIYTLYINPENRHIAGLVGFVVAIEGLADGRGYLSYNISDMTEAEYNMVSESINSTECMTFLDTDNRTIIQRRVCIDLLDNTFYDATVNKIYGVDNIVKIRVRCVDNTVSTVDDVTEIVVKNVKKGRQPMTINGLDPDVVKTTVPNNSEVTLELLGDGTHTLKIKATLPTVSYLWLTAYPQLLALTDEQNAGLKAHIASIASA